MTHSNNAIAGKLVLLPATNTSSELARKTQESKASILLVDLISKRLPSPSLLKAIKHYG